MCNVWFFFVFQAEIGDTLSVHYVGRLNDENGKIFDESRPRANTFNFQLGAGQVIQVNNSTYTCHTLGHHPRARGESVTALAREENYILLPSRPTGRLEETVVEFVLFTLSMAENLQTH